MNRTTENRSPQAIPNQGILNLARSVLKISRLPAAPTFDWTSQAAKALAPLNQGTSTGVVVLQRDKNTNKYTVESSGVHISQAAQDSIESGQARCLIERISSTPIDLTDENKDTGYIGSISRLFPQWVASKASLPWASPHPTQSLAAYAPMSNTTSKDPNTALALLVFASHDQPSIPPIDSASLAAVLAVIADKASTAIQPDRSGSVLWLTQREQAILDLLIDGNSVREIAESIARSPHTVHDHVKNLHRKLGASSRGQLITRALGHHQSTEKLRLLTPAIDPQLFHYSNNSAQNQNAQLKGISELKLTAPSAARQAVPLNPTTNAN